MKEELIRSCQQIGRKIPLWIQGPGGNLSVKLGDELLIKASGARLDEVSHKTGLATASLSLFKKLWKPAHEEGYAELIRESALLGRPSMETGFHALLRKKWVAHFHALSSLLMAHQFNQNATRFTSFWNRTTTLSFKVIPPIMPGLQLSALLAETPEIDCFIMTNHGVVLQSESNLDGILNEFQKIEAAFLKEYGYRLQPKLPSDLAEVELKFYFPDTAVLLEKIQSITEETSDRGRKLKSEARQTQPGAFELLWATETLLRAEPELAELPAEIWQKVGNLPTEITRKNLLR